MSEYFETYSRAALKGPALGNKIVFIFKGFYRRYGGFQFWKVFMFSTVSHGDFVALQFSEKWRLEVKS